MPGNYHTVPLAPARNAGVAALGPAPAPTLGTQTMRGLPFDVGTDPLRCFVRLDPGGPIQIPLPQPELPVRWVVFAHRVVESRVLAGGPVGEVVGTYTFQHRSGRRGTVPIRERFEASIAQTTRAEWGQLPMLAVPSRFDTLPPRDHGSFASFGHRLTEIEMVAADFFLWAWESPDPDDPPASVELAAGPASAGLVVAGITLGTADEHPLRLLPAQPVTVTATGAPPGDRLSVTVDRGVSTFSRTARPGPGDPADPLTGWGGEQARDDTRVYAMVAALPSATLEVAAGEEVLARTTWRELAEQGRIHRDGVRVEVVESGRNWVRTTIVDDDTGQPVPCRIHFRSVAGVPYQPYGHANHLNSDLYEYKAKLGIHTGTWGIDFGGDVRLGGVTYAYVDGRCEGWLPRGEVVVEAARGFEYEPVRRIVTLESGQRELTVRLKRRSDLAADGWFSGDTHVHFLSVASAHLEAAGEDLNVVNLLATQWGSHFSSTDQFTGAPSISADGRTIVYVSQENRQHILGHLALLGLKEPVMPWCTDGPPEAATGSALESALAHWADRCHEQGGLVVLPHFPNPNGEQAALVATARVDAVEFAEFLPYSHHQYYRYLNAGYRLPVVGGTDKMSGDVPVGLYRTYARIPPGEPLTYANWCQAVLAGRTFMSSGPLISLTVDGQPIGSTVRLPAGGGTVAVEATVSSIFPVHTLEIVQGGRVVGSASSRAGTGALAVSEMVRVPGDTWIAARTAGPHYSPGLRHRDDWERAVMAHTSPIYLSSGDRWQPGERAAYHEMLAMIDGGLGYIRQLSPQWDDRTVTHHHGFDDHREFLERPFHEAREAIAARLRSLP
jgi:hypothetical protein